MSLLVMLCLILTQNEPAQDKAHVLSHRKIHSKQYCMKINLSLRAKDAYLVIGHMSQAGQNSRYYDVQRRASIIKIWREVRKSRSAA